MILFMFTFNSAAKCLRFQEYNLFHVALDEVPKWLPKWNKRLADLGFHAAFHKAILSKLQVLDRMMFQTNASCICSKIQNNVEIVQEKFCPSENVNSYLFNQGRR